MDKRFEFAFDAAAKPESSAEASNPVYKGLTTKRRNDARATFASRYEAIVREADAATGAK